jgi:hypothetical protein
MLPLITAAYFPFHSSFDFEVMLLISNWSFALKIDLKGGMPSAE